RPTGRPRGCRWACWPSAAPAIRRVAGHGPRRCPSPWPACRAAWGCRRSKRNAPSTHLLELATEEQQRLRLADHGHLLDGGDHDQVIATVELIGQPAVDIGQHAVRDRVAGARLRPRKTGELVAAAARQGERDLLVVGGQETDREPPDLADPRPR